MGVYIFQLIFLLGSSAVVNNCSGLDKAKKHKMILAINIFLMWILCVLKKYTVGIDVAGYKRVYEASASWPWFAFSNVYYEYGYTALMQLFSKNGANFQLFNLFVYTIIYVPIFVFFNRYSKQPTMSLLIFICYQFWVFNMSGLRQGMAMSICLLAYIFLEKKSWMRIAGFIVAVLLASLIHQSALIFLIALGSVFFEVTATNALIFVTMALGCVLLRSSIVSLVNSFAGKYQITGGMTLGGSFLLLLGLAVFSYAVILITEKGEKVQSFNIDTASVFMLIFSVILNLCLNGSSVLRAASYASIFVTIAFPNCMMRCTKKSRWYINILFAVLLIGLWFTDVLMANQLDIIPYKMFWQ